MKRWLPILLLLGACSGPEPAADDVLLLTYASPYTPNHPFSLADRDWIDYVESESDGQIQIRAVWSGALLSSDQSMIELRHGVSDIGLVTPIYAKGGAHLIRTQTGFYSGITSQESQIELFRCLASMHPQLAAETDGLKILAVQGGNLPAIVTRNTPIRSLADLKGLRIRAPTELLPVMQALGAEPVSLPMGDVYSAMAKGVIDGVIAPTDTFRSLHFAEVAQHYARLKIPRGAYPARAMSEKRWQALPEDARALLQRSIPVWEQAMIRRTTEAVEAGATYGAEHGMTETIVPQAEQREFLQIYSRFAEESATELERLDIDGLAVLETARASISPDGTVKCWRQD